MKDDADPLSRWSYNEYIEFASFAENDAYGALFFYLRDILLAFCKRIHSFAISFQLLATDAVNLPEYLTDIKFDRIEVRLELQKSHQLLSLTKHQVSNICDRSYVGPRRTLSTFSPLLKLKSQNPRATLLLLFLNVVREEEDHSLRRDAVAMARRGRLIRKYFNDTKPQILDAVLGKGGPASMQYITTPELALLTDVMMYWDDFDITFARFLGNADPESEKPISLKDLAARHGLKIKDKHSIVQPWPYRASERMTRKELDLLVAESTNGHERYIEISRA
jgi:hypothetical protein